MSNKTKIYTVTQLNSLIKITLEENLPSRLTIAGQISDWRHHQSGHCYFSLKDQNAVLPCVMWASNFRKVKFAVENGLAVLATGSIDVYVPQGRYQLMVDKLIPEGVGALQLAFEQLVAKLRTQGLFDDIHKKPLPPYPKRIGILTSKSGAAVRDITDSIHNRWPIAELFLYPVPVQGEGSAEKIAQALRDINKRNSQLKLDLLIVGRGGGSMEDLWAFNEEVLARAIFDSKIPIISAVGHEIDTTIADFVADARASTPTKAGVAAVPDIHEVLEQLTAVENRLTDDINAKLKLANQNLRTILASTVFKNPLLSTYNKQQQLDEIEVKLTAILKELLAQAAEKIHYCFQQISKIEPHRLLGKKTLDLNNLKNQMITATNAVVNNCQIKLTAQQNRLLALNPKSVLQRGYSITTSKKTRLPIKTLDDVKLEDLIITELAGENLIESKVTKKQNRADNN